MKTAFATIKGFEIMKMFKKGQFDIWTGDQGVKGEVRLIESQFGSIRPYKHVIQR